MVTHLEENPLRTTLYADDIALVADSQDEVEEKVRLWQGVLAENGLRLIVKKKKFISSEQCTGPILCCQWEAVEKVGELRYRGSDVSEIGSVEQAVRRRINAASMDGPVVGQVQNEDVRTVMKIAPIQLKMKDSALGGTETPSEDQRIIT
ncbi:unnamed protein product [Heligmosomoides polygyrus]|uniref:Reverse transcriptase domain-containing protein n=1 Tax=Heligmosomoides polygyrus TaxID=6339 RepID=A0A183FUF2_HELPZ|nr:unnamed protein product [Heligmosomoides polygyrus]